MITNPLSIYPRALHCLTRPFSSTSPSSPSPPTSLVPSLERDPLPNVVVLTSLSKTLGVPGVRLGYVYSCDERLNTEITSALPIWNLNSLA